MKNATTQQRNQFFFLQPKIFLENVSQDLDADDDDKLFLDNSANNKSESLQNIQVPTVVADDDTVLAIENEVARAHDLLDLELSGHGFKRSPAAAASISNQYNNHEGYTNMPSGIRSAIAASAAIVLTSLITFMLIFIIFRWKQRKQRKSSYMKTYNAMKSKMPGLSANSRCSSARNLEEIVSSGGIATITQSPLHQLERQSSLLFPRHSCKESTSVTGRHNYDLLGQRKDDNENLEHVNKHKKTHHHHHHHHNGIGTMTPLALSLQNVPHISSTKLNSMDTLDTASPQVRDYLFDALHKSF